MKRFAVLGLPRAVLIALVPLAAGSPLEAVDLFQPAAVRGDLLGVTDIGVLRSRPVLWNPAALPGANQSGALPLTGHRLRLNLFDDVDFAAVMDRVEVLPKGISWVGHLEGDALGSVVIVVYDGVMSASITSPAAAYAVRYAGAGTHLVQEIDRSAYPTDEPDFVPAPPYELSPPADLSTAADDGSTVDLLVAYTPAAKTAAGGETAILSRISLGVAETNTAYANSGVIQRLRLVHAAEVAYTESGSLSTDLNRVTNTADGFIDNVHTLRDTYGADMVQLIVSDASLTACGIGWLMGTPSAAFKTNAFTVTEQVCISPNYTFGHELGHNMGLNHARDDDGCPTGYCGYGSFSYAFGYKEPSGLFRTVMAYACTSGSCPRVLHFSNPNVTYLGRATGVSSTASNSADNAQALNNTRMTVANWRTAIPATKISIDDRAVAEGNAANASFRVALDVASSQTVTVNYATANGTATAPSDYAATSGTLTFTPGRTTHSIAVPIVADATPEGAETFTVTLSSATNATILRAQATGTISDPPTPTTGRMFRAYNPNADYHFFTTSFPEFANAVSAGYRDEASGRTGFCVPNTQVGSSVVIFRMYNPNTGRHYYSVGVGERDSLKTAGWVYEKDEGSIYTTQIFGTTEIFKLYNQNSGVHLYTESAATKNTILALFPGIWFQHTSMGFAFDSPTSGYCPP